MSTWLKVVIPLVLIAGGIYAYTLYNKPRKDLERTEAAYKLSAEELAASFIRDESEANRLYLGKVLEVEGNVSELLHDGETAGLILMGDSGGSVYCSFASAPPVRPGEIVTVKGTCSGFLMDVVLNDCILKQPDL